MSNSFYENFLNRFSNKLNQLSINTLEKSKNRTVNSAINVERFNGKTPSEFVASITKEHLGLGDLQNNEIATITDIVSRNINNKYITPQNVHLALDIMLDYISELGLPYDTLSSDGVRHIGDDLLKRINVVENSDELDLLLNTEESFATVFNNWTRISHLRDIQPFSTSELTAWSYNSITDSIRNTTNSASLIGFISPERYRDFEFEVRVSSTDSDDDSIGICFGFIDDGNKQHTLTAMRTPGGSQTHPTLPNGSNHRAKLFDIYYNIFDSDRRDLGSTNGGLKWGDGVVNDNRVMGGDPTWARWSNHPGGCRIKAVREGDIITLSTTDLDSNIYVSTANVVIDLTSHPELMKFRGQISVGYVAYSQNQSTWDVIQRPGARIPIIEASNLNTWVWQNGQWNNVPSDFNNYIKPDRFYFNETTGKLFYALNENTIIRVGSR